MRLSYGGSLCTVRYSGPLPVWTQQAYGVEWDDASRGKHSGELQGVSYFTCTVPGAGSFVKTSKKPDITQSFYEAIYTKYIQEHKFEEIALSSVKIVESVGIEKYHDRQKNVNNLRVISLANCSIDRLDNGGLSELPQLCGLRELDLSHNLLENIGELLEFLSQFGLEKLNLAGNRFSIFDIKVRLPSVLELNLGDTLLSEDQLALVLNAFPKLQRLGLSRNRYSKIVEIPPYQWIDLAYNNLTTPPNTGNELILSNNKVSQITQPLYYKSLNLMDQSVMNMLSWADIDHLFVDELWLSEAAHFRSVIIGRLGRLQKLNGTSVSQEERRDCELYLLSLVNKGEQPPLPPLRHATLQATYGPTKNPSHQSNSIRARLINITVENELFRIVHNATIYRLIAMVARKRQISAQTIQLIHNGAPLQGHQRIHDTLQNGDVINMNITI